MGLTQKSIIIRDSPMPGQPVSMWVRQSGLQNEESMMQMNNHSAPLAEALLSSSPEQLWLAPNQEALAACL